MATRVIPLLPGSNQSFTCTLPVDSKNITLSFTFTWNDMGEYWFMSIVKNDVLLLDAVPLVTGDYPAADILGQYEYMGLGSAAIVPVSSTVVGMPGKDNLGSEYVLVWTDTLR